MDPNEPVTIFAGDPIEARLVHGHLKGHGISAHVIDENIALLMPGYAAPGGAGAVKILVARKDVDAAIEILEASPPGEEESG